ncbi:MAG: TetR/AcrR family transcriptional regulator [Streptosporangiaceae bacterium]
MPSSPAARGDSPPVKGHAHQRRSDRARIAVLHAADDLLVERGYAGVTIEGIAARAGVAKQTIYRWWPSKFEILMDTLLQDAAGALAVPDTGTVAQDLRQHLRQLADFLSAQPAGRVMLALIGQAQHDAGVARAFQQRFGDERRAQDRVIAERAQARGEVAPGTDLDLLTDMIYGPLYHRVLLTGLPVDGPFIDGLVDHVLASVSRPARSSS